MRAIESFLPSSVFGEKQPQGYRLLKGITVVISHPQSAYRNSQLRSETWLLLLRTHLSALRKLQSSIEQGFFCYGYFISDPLTENLRAENKYLTLMEKAEQRHEEFKRRFF